MTFFASGAVYGTVRYLLPAMAYFVPIIIVAVVGVFLWLALEADDVSGLSDIMVASFKTLSGVDNPNDIFFKCDVRPSGVGSAFAHLGWTLLALGLAIVNAAPGLTAIIGLPIGALMTLLGSVMALVKRDTGLVIAGLATFTIGMAGVIVGGLMMRLIHYITTADCY